MNNTHYIIVDTNIVDGFSHDYYKATDRKYWQPCVIQFNIPNNCKECNLLKCNRAKSDYDLTNNQNTCLYDFNNIPLVMTYFEAVDFFKKCNNRHIENDLLHILLNQEEILNIREQLYENISKYN